MKKFLTAFLGFTLAGAMTFGLAACKPDDENKDEPPAPEEPSVIDAIKSTLEQSNYKLQIVADVTNGFMYNGELIAEDTVLNTPMGEMSGLDFFQAMTEEEKFENPLKVTITDQVYCYDFVNGKVSSTEYEEENGETEEQTEYYEVDGTTINRYDTSTMSVWNPDTEEYDYTEYQVQYSYTGYASNDKAKEVLQNSIKYMDADGALESIMDVKLKGVGENASREGTLEELADLFEYDEASKTYSIDVNASAAGGIDYSDCHMEITVEDGKATQYVLSVESEEDLSEMLNGISVKSKMVSTSKYGDFGEVSITVPDEYKQVEEQNIHVTPELTSEDNWKELLAAYDDNTEFHISNYAVDTSGGNIATISTEIYVDTENNLAMVTTRTSTISSNETVESKYYKVDGNKLLTYSGIYEENEYSQEFKGYSEPVETAITGEATAALIAVLPQIARDYYAGFEGGALSQQFSKFDFARVSELSANLQLNGKDVKVEVTYSYSDIYYLNSVELNYGDDEYYRVANDASWQLENYNPDNINN